MLAESLKQISTRKVKRFSTGGKVRAFWVSLLLAALAVGSTNGSAITLAELRADPHLTPARFMSYFSDFKFQLGSEVRKPDVFLSSQAGDCDDFASLAAQVLREKGYTTRLVAVFMPEAVHVVCYVAETNSYLDYNCRALASPLVKCDSSLSAIATSVAASFRLPWRSVSEFTLHDNVPQFVMTEFH